MAGGGTTVPEVVYHTVNKGMPLACSVKLRPGKKFRFAATKTSNRESYPKSS